MDWQRIVLAFARSYAVARGGLSKVPDVEATEQEPGVWRCLWPIPVKGEIGMIIVTGEDQVEQLPAPFQEWIKSDGGEDVPLWGWPIHEERS